MTKSHMWQTGLVFMLCTYNEWQTKIHFWKMKFIRGIKRAIFKFWCNCTYLIALSGALLTLSQMLFVLQAWGMNSCCSCWVGMAQTLKMELCCQLLCFLSLLTSIVCNYRRIPLLQTATLESDTFLNFEVTCFEYYFKQCIMCICVFVSAVWKYFI